MKSAKTKLSYILIKDIVFSWKRLKAARFGRRSAASRA